MQNSVKIKGSMPFLAGSGGGGVGVRAMINSKQGRQTRISPIRNRRIRLFQTHDKAQFGRLRIMFCISWSSVSRGSSLHWRVGESAKATHRRLSR